MAFRTLFFVLVYKILEVCLPKINSLRSRAQNMRRVRKVIQCCFFFVVVCYAKKWFKVNITFFVQKRVKNIVKFLQCCN